ncbi:MAG TPA: hypothetical protein VGT06_09035 [Candidatus Methylomirabilis sp.]|nr:hypothetical protein [Candidatus Methylomirabilis sp.]
MKRLLWLAAVASLATGCATPLTPRERGAITGAALGASIGAIAGSPSGRGAEGAIIGGMGGAVVGGVLAEAAQQRQAAVRPPARPAPVVVAQPPAVITPPPVVVTETPTWVLVPGTAVYYSPEIQADVYLHSGVWYYRVNGGWFTGASHTGPWELTPVTAVPVMVTRIPPGWRATPGPPALPPGLRKKMGG